MDKNNTLKYGVIAAGLVVSGVLVYKYMYAETEDQKIRREMDEDIKTLGHVSKDSSGTIKVQDFIELFKIITKYSKQKIKSVKRKNAAKRRQFINDDEVYKELITNQLNEEEKIYQEYANYIMDYFNIEENDFLIAQQVHMGNPLFQRTMAALQNDFQELEQFVPPISREKTKEIFMFVEEQKFKTMENVMRRQSYGEIPASETTLALLVEHSRLEDMLCEKYGIEAEEFSK